jgi:hypothetical protein
MLTIFIRLIIDNSTAELLKTPAAAGGFIAYLKSIKPAT